MERQPVDSIEMTIVKSAVGEKYLVSGNHQEEVKLVVGLFAAINSICHFSLDTLTLPPTYVGVREIEKHFINSVRSLLLENE